MEWQLQAIRGATTVSQNTVEAIQEAVMELLDEIEVRNQFAPTAIISATFTVTRDLDAIFPAAIARKRPDWDNVPMLDVQQMHVEGSLERCIRLLIHINLPVSHVQICHTYLRQATTLRPDWSLPQPTVLPPPTVQSNHCSR